MEDNKMRSLVSWMLMVLFLCAVTVILTFCIIYLVGYIQNMCFDAGYGWGCGLGLLVSKKPTVYNNIDSDPDISARQSKAITDITVHARMCEEQPMKCKYKASCDEPDGSCVYCPYMDSAHW